MSLFFTKLIVKTLSILFLLTNTNVTQGLLEELPQDIFIFSHLTPHTRRGQYEEIYSLLNITWKEIRFNYYSNNLTINNHSIRVRLLRTDCTETCDHKSIMNRQKRDIFGKDNREAIRPKHAKEYPYAGVVKLSVGCSGILIDPKHVLTAAHCFFLKNKWTIKDASSKIGIKKSSGITWYRIASIYMPSKWLQNNINYDYCVVEIENAINKRKPTKLGLSVYSDCPSNHTHGSGSSIEFTGFPDDKSPKYLWNSKCKLLATNYYLFWHECDAKPGSSGSGIITKFNNKENSSNSEDNVYRTIGVLSGKRWYQAGNRDLNVGVRMNLYNFLSVCIWSRNLDQCIQRYKWLFPNQPLTYITQNV